MRHPISSLKEQIKFILLPNQMLAQLCLEDGISSRSVVDYIQLENVNSSFERKRLKFG